MFEGLKSTEAAQKPSPDGHGGVPALPRSGKVSNSGGAYLRDIELEDLLELQNSEIGSKPPALKRIREQHHHLARLLADGVRPTAAGIVAGFCPSRVSVLQRDPAFSELIDFYASKKDEILANFDHQLETLTHSTLQELLARLDAAPDTFEAKELISLLTSMMDRTGRGPSSTVKNLNLTMSAEDLARLKEAVDGRTLGKVIEKTAEEAEAVQEDSGTSEGDDERSEPAREGEIIEVEILSGEGSGV